MQVKECKIKHILGSRWSHSREESLSCHINSDTMPRFFPICSEVLPNLVSFYAAKEYREPFPLEPHGIRSWLLTTLIEKVFLSCHLDWKNKISELYRKSIVILLLSILVINEKFYGLFQRHTWRCRTELLSNSQIKI